MTFEQKIKYLRKREGITQENLAKRLNLSRQAIAKWECGNAMPDIYNLKEMANLFGVTIDELLTEKDIEIKEDNISIFEIIMQNLMIFAWINMTDYAGLKHNLEIRNENVSKN